MCQALYVKYFPESCEKNVQSHIAWLGFELPLASASMLNCTGKKKSEHFELQPGFEINDRQSK